MTTTRVTYRWDNRPGVEPGWYCQSYTGNHTFCDDSQKVWFPVNVEDFSADDRAELDAALRAAFPNAEVEENPT